jgi:hypothetical protein
MQLCARHEPETHTCAAPQLAPSTLLLEIPQVVTVPAALQLVW